MMARALSTAWRNAWDEAKRKAQKNSIKEDGGTLGMTITQASRDAQDRTAHSSLYPGTQAQLRCVSTCPFSGPSKDIG